MTKITSFSVTQWLGYDVHYELKRCSGVVGLISINFKLM